MPKKEDIASHRTLPGKHDKLIVDLEATPKSLQQAAPRTNGEKHFDRTIAVGLFFTIYAASVVGAVVIKKHPMGNKWFYNPLKKGFMGITEFFFRNSTTKAAGEVVEAALAKPEGILSEIKKVLWDVEIAEKTTGASSEAFKSKFAGDKSFLSSIQPLLSKMRAGNLATEIDQVLSSVPDAEKATLRPILESLRQTIENGKPLEKDIVTRLQKVITEYRLDKKSEELSEIISLSMGGTAVVVPYKFYDDAKHKAIIQDFDKAHGTGIDDPVLEAAALRRIDQTATQSWPSALLTRFGALGVLVITAYTPWLGETIIGAQKSMSNVMMETKPANKLMEWAGKLDLPWFPFKPAASGAALDAASATNKQFVGDMVSADFSWTVYTTGLMLAFSKVFAPIFGNKPTKAEAGAYQPYVPPRKEVPVAHTEDHAAKRQSAALHQEAAPAPKVRHVAHEERLTASEGHAVSHS